MTVATEIWIPALQHVPVDAKGLTMRRLTDAEVLQQARERLGGWLAWELGSPEDEPTAAAVERAIEADAVLGDALAPRALDARRVGIVLDDAVRERLRTAISR